MADGQVFGKALSENRYNIGGRDGLSLGGAWSLLVRLVEPTVLEVDGEMRRNAEMERPLRRATRDDSRRIAELMEIAGEGIPTYLWSRAARDGQQPIDVGAERAAREDGSFSYRNAVVAEVDGEVVALLLAYRLPEAEEVVDLEGLPELLRPLVELELLVPGTFYVNALATLPERRGEGLGSRLLDAANALATEAGCDELSIEVFEQNEGAVGLYGRHGYRIVARRQVVSHPCHPYDGDVVLMTRKVVRA